MENDNNLGFEDMLPMLEVSCNGQVGSLKDMMNLTLVDAINRSIKLGKKSSITLTLEVNMKANNMFTIMPRLSAKLPDYSLDNAKSFYRDDSGNITANNPRQNKMFDSNGELISPLKRVNAA